MIYFLSTLFIYIVFPKASLITLFAPFLVRSYYFMPKSRSIMWSFAAGFVIDVTTYALPLGSHALIYCLATLFLYDKKQHFFLDNLSTFPIMTFFFSILSTSMTLLFCQCQLSIPLIISDFIIMPFADAIFAFVLYTLPYRWMGPKKRAGHEYFI